MVKNGILFLSLFVLLPPVHRFIPLLRLTFSPLRSTSSPIGILDFDPAPCMSSLGHGLGSLRGWRSWSLSVYSGRPRRCLWTVKRTLNLLLLLLLHGKAYEQRLIEVKLTTLETRRLRGDLIEMFKILKGFDKTSLPIATNNLSNRRGHSLKLFKQRFNTNIGKFLFVTRTIDEWNKLSDDRPIVSCNTVNNFKNELDRYL